MRPFWMSFFENVRQCGRHSATFIATLAAQEPARRMEL